ncbi:MAG: hypothetical protein IPH26_16740 [Sterolibacteriaceae bacterium]|uniref:Uncharacterized protein n=1 Tax=Candidatus Methylophosphatis roskildensis TaxID=2899263 RepID=A0A9D7HN76_9PROT|nr:hypothetical protein [Candidatus Methylophosphatis roskildensis]MBK7236197.1 hypothetical protein [Sterolibacteriaceae bacterium]
MKPHKILLLSALLAVAGAAFAASAAYTDTMKKIDTAMASGQHTPTTTDEVRKLVADSRRMMEEGKEAEAMKLLEKAMQLLDVK